jgi:predicted O-methyltransferase YrrM
LRTIAKNAAKPARFGRFFFRLIRNYQIDSVLELGTSLGLTTRYFSKALQNGSVISIEGSPVIAELVQRSLVEEGYKNTQILQGDFDHQLIPSFNQLNGKKLIFFDGNHKYEPTMRYFKQVLPLCGELDILVFDDIYWSAEMEHAWSEIKNCEKVTLTIDLFFVGLVFFRKDFKEKLDFMIRF